MKLMEKQKKLPLPFRFVARIEIPVITPEKGGGARTFVIELFFLL